MSLDESNTEALLETVRIKRGEYEQARDKAERKHAELFAALDRYLSSIAADGSGNNDGSGRTLAERLDRVHDRLTVKTRVLRGRNTVRWEQSPRSTEYRVVQDAADRLGIEPERLVEELNSRDEKAGYEQPDSDSSDGSDG
jgi:hypothetical protein